MRIIEGIIIGISAGFTFAVVLILFGISIFYLGDFDPVQSYEYNDIEEYKIIDSSHRLLEAASYEDGLYIVGELEISQPIENLVEITAILSNESGSFVGSCDSWANPTKRENIYRFEIHCPSIDSLDQFAEYSFEVKEAY